jgi:transposase-like protein
VQSYAPELEKRCRPHLKATADSWRVDETYVKVKKVWMYLYRAVDSQGNTMEFLLSPRRDAEAAKRFFAKALASPHISTPRVITVDKKRGLSKGIQGVERGGYHARPLRTAAEYVPQQPRRARQSRASNGSSS